MKLTIGHETVKFKAWDAVRVSEDYVQKMVDDVARELERIHEDILAGGKYLKNDEGGYFEMTFIATGDVFVFGTITVYNNGEVVYEVEVMRPEKKARIYFNPEAL